MTIAVVAAVQSQAPRAAGSAPVVLELFTSQGCSSCPPADELLRRIARDPRFRGKVIPLAYHVDYWNSLGWRDPFSSREWSQRQGDYVRAMKLASAYTPQLVINGSRQLVGSNTFAIERAIAEESERTPSGSVTLQREGDFVVVEAKPPANADVVLVTFENGLTTHVAAGENRGKTIVNDAIVRSLRRVTPNARVKVDAKYGVAAFLQDRGTRRILASAGVER